MSSPNNPEVARTQALCWLLDELLDAEDDLLALVARPEALSGWRRERLGEFCQRVGDVLLGSDGQRYLHPKPKEACISRKPNFVKTIIPRS